jgi:hypothetical protein
VNFISTPFQSEEVLPSITTHLALRSLHTSAEQTAETNAQQEFLIQ